MQIEYRVSPEVTNQELNTLFADAWGEPSDRDFAPVLERSLAYICAYSDGELVGFVNVAWDGGIHAFVLDTTVRSHLRLRGIGTRLVQEAADAARTAGAQWLHVDYEPRLAGFYTKCGFGPTAAGLMDLTNG